MGGFFRIVDALVAFPEDVLQHHNRVVHQHAHAQRQPAQRHDVEREVGEAHEHEGGQHRERNGQSDDERLPERLQEHQHHYHREDRAQQRGVAHRVDRVPDEPGLVLDHPVLDVARDKPVLGEGREFLVHVVGHAHSVGVGLLPERHLDGRYAVEPGPEPLLLVRVLDEGYVAERNPPPAAHIQQHRADVLHAAKLAGGLAHQLALERAHPSRGNVLVLVADRVDDLRYRDAVGLEPFLVEDHADLAHQPAGDVYRRHARHRQQLGTEPVFHPGAEPHEVTRRRGERDLVHRDLRRVRLPDCGRVGLFRQLRACAVEVGGGILQCEIDIGAVAEVEIDAHPTFLHLGLDSHQVLGGGERRLERLGHCLFHHPRLDPRVVDPDPDLGIDNLGEEVERQPPEKDQTQHHYDRREHHRADGPHDGPAGQLRPPLVRNLCAH